MAIVSLSTCHDSDTAWRDSTRPLANLPLAVSPQRQSRMHSVYTACDTLRVMQ